MSTATNASKYLFLDALSELLYFPFWWYSAGFKKAAIFCWQQIKTGWRVLALTILLSNFFKSMYGERGWDAYVLSLLSRLFQLCWRLITMFVYFSFWLAVFCLWIILIPLIIWQLGS